MTDKELADKIVALGVGENDTFRPYMYTLGKFESVRYEAKEYVRDWRVAGALLEKCDGHLEALIALNSIDYLPKETNLARELTEACVARLS